MTGRILEECQLCMRETMRQTGNELKTEGPRTGPLRDEGGRQSQAGRGDAVILGPQNVCPVPRKASAA